ncbi:NUDIX hydrolase domain-like protein [Lipomyces arxii]|uniref:NUDIX hydrolase domain-like protein n=1 Tax=Lipomyces arxii TaxID=56418 RepID=UPI0034CD6E2A
MISRLQMLSRKSIDCLQSLRHYVPPPTAWHNVPLSRRSAVLILLHPNANGDLSVVLTMRAAKMSSFSNQAAFPGGKADLETESEFQVARREAFEEIGFPLNLDTSKYRYEEITTFPAHLARNWLVVRPVLAYISHRNETDGPIDLNEVLRLNSCSRSDEVSAVFTVPLDKFLKADKGWYNGSWMDWSGLRWRQHIFSVPSTKQDIVPNRGESKPQSVYRVWGLTARMLLDAARIGYKQEPEMEFICKDGDELLISKLMEIGRLGPIRDKAEISIRFSDLFDRDLLAKL